MDKAKQGSASAVATGLRGVVAASSSIGDVNGEKGELIYQGIDIHDLATKSTFEEVVFLLWNGRLPKRAELDELRANIGASYEIPQWVRGPIEYFPKDAEPMDTLRTAVSALSFFDKEARDLSRAASIRVATRLTAQFPTIVAAIDRARNGKDPIKPRPDLNIATNFLYMLKGEMPDETILGELALHFPHERPQRILRTVVAWARYAELFKYSSTRKVLYGLNPTSVTTESRI